jgi:hypothetical protein
MSIYDIAQSKRTPKYWKQIGFYQRQPHGGARALHLFGDGRRLGVPSAGRVLHAGPKARRRSQRVEVTGQLEVTRCSLKPDHRPLHSPPSAQVPSRHRAAGHPDGLEVLLHPTTNAAQRSRHLPGTRERVQVRGVRRPRRREQPCPLPGCCVARPGAILVATTTLA